MPHTRKHCKSRTCIITPKIPTSQGACGGLVIASGFRSERGPPNPGILWRSWWVCFRAPMPRREHGPPPRLPPWHARLCPIASAMLSSWVHCGVHLWMFHCASFWVGPLFVFVSFVCLCRLIARRLSRRRTCSRSLTSCACCQVDGPVFSSMHRY